MSVISEPTRKNATIVVRNSIALTKSKAPGGARRASSAHSLPRGQPRSVLASRPPVPLFHANTPKIPAAGNRLSLPPLTASFQPSEAERFGSWAETTIQSQQKDIDRVSGTVGRVERDMQSFKEFMEEVRSELTSSRENMVQAKDDLNKIQMQTEETAQRPRSRDGVNILSKRLDAITDDILLVNQRASKVDQLQEELRKMQDRLVSLERKAASQDFPNHKTAQAKARTPAVPQKRRQDEIASLRTPSSNARSPPKHPSKRTRFSDINVEDIDQNYEPSGESHLTIATPPRKAREIPVSQQVNSSPPVVNEDDYGVPAYDENRDTESILPAVVSTPTAPTTSKPTQRRTSGVSIPANSIEALNSSPRQLRNRSTANKRKSDVTHNMPTLSGKRRNSEGVLVSVDGTIDKRSLRKRQSAAALGSKVPTELIELPIAGATLSASQNNGVSQVVASVEVTRASPRTQSRPAVPKVFTPAPTRAFTPMNPIQAPGGDGKPFKCGVCDKRFASFHALSFVSLIPYFVLDSH